MDPVWDTCLYTSSYFTFSELQSPLNRSPTIQPTKIICTLGPSTSSVETLVELIDNGMSIARFNFSHGSYKKHQEMMDMLNKARLMRPNAPVATLLDTKGSEIRTSDLADGAVKFLAGDTFTIVTDWPYMGTKHRIAVSHKYIADDVSPGNVIGIADGQFMVKVTKVFTDSIEVAAINDFLLTPRKNVTLMGNRVSMDALQEQDINDIINFLVPNEMDFLAISFVQTPEDIRQARTILNQHNSRTSIIAKIENLCAIENIKTIIKHADGVMIARGDLGMNIPLERIFYAQKAITALCNASGKPVITATQMMESMLDKPQPTRAEVTDIANAVIDGVDCVMLSGETANGKFPVNAVSTMNRVCLSANSCINYDRTNPVIRKLPDHVWDFSDTVAKAALHAAAECSSVLICIVNDEGEVARKLAALNPQHQILFTTRDVSIARRCNIVKGLRGIVVNKTVSEDELTQRLIDYSKSFAGVKRGTYIVFTYLSENFINDGSFTLKLRQLD